MSDTIIQDPLQAHVQAAAEAYLAQHSGLQFSNYGDDDTYDKLITIAQLANGDIARNNCLIASRELVEVAEDNSFGGERPHLIAIANEDTYHAAIATWVENDWYVIDFTARQFDPNLPFPLVAQQWTWKETIDGLNENFTAFCKDASDPSSFEDEDAWSDDYFEDED